VDRVIAKRGHVKKRGNQFQSVNKISNFHHALDYDGEKTVKRGGGVEKKSERRLEN